MSNSTSIPIMRMARDIHEGIYITKLYPSEKSSLNKIEQSHRHDFHFFLLQKKGEACFEIDFESYNTTPRTVLYIHPNQVHRLISEKEVEFHILSIKSEFLQKQPLKILEELVPLKPLILSNESYELLNKSFSLCTDLFENNEDLYASTLINSCRTFASLVIAQYIQGTKPISYHTRPEIITKEFKQLLENNYINSKRPADYANRLHISPPYLNQCVRSVTGFSVSHHIQQRVILEAKRLLFHSDTSIKEIATTLGYEDHAYFSRLFAKVNGMTAIEFRKRIFD